MNPSTIEYDEGKLTLSMPRPGVFVSEVIGYMRVEEARAFIAYGDQILNQHGKLRGFHDWTAEVGYTYGCRLVTTEWSMRRLAQLEAVHIALHSPMVRAAVAVANIGLRGRITMHHSVESLWAARAAAR